MTIEQVEVKAFKILTRTPEQDGTLNRATAPSRLFLRNPSAGICVRVLGGSTMG
ncbi:MAG TPA: hypothetical protein VNJ08_10390 [Bacteriovoracaceae bacterium]|nr:hypothetical protein [Bacteriovoracaceae bacterium]